MLIKMNNFTNSQRSKTYLEVLANPLFSLVIHSTTVSMQISNDDERISQLKIPFLCFLPEEDSEIAL